MLNVVRKTQQALPHEKIAEVAVRHEEIKTPVILTPTRIETMIGDRRKYQVVKFRSTCSDCVPNL